MKTSRRGFFAALMATAIMPALVRLGWKQRAQDTSGISIMMRSRYDVVTDRNLVRLDVLYGYSIVHGAQHYQREYNRAYSEQIEMIMRRKGTTGVIPFPYRPEMSCRIEG
jgi:hypothetical protein